MKKSKVLVLTLLLSFVAAMASYAQVKAESYPDAFTDSKAEAYPQLFAEKAGSNILIMPPINLTNEVEAKEYFYYTLNTQLAASGWYVYPPILALRTLQEESADNAELFVNANISKFGEIFGADYLLFTTIERWYKSKGKKEITVVVDYNLRSTKTNDTVYEHQCSYTYDLSGVDKRMADSALDLASSGNLYSMAIGGMAMLATTVTTAVITGTTNTMDVARYCNAYALYDLPFGPLFGTQGEDADAEAAEYASGFVTQY